MRGARRANMVNAGKRRFPQVILTLFFGSHGPLRAAKIASEIVENRLPDVEDSAIAFVPAASASARTRQTILQNVRRIRFPNKRKRFAKRCALITKQLDELFARQAREEAERDVPVEQDLKADPV
jgi:hypothetical protein